MVVTKSGRTKEVKTFRIEYDDITPYGLALEELQDEIDAHEIIVGFNLKFDLHWLRRYGIVLSAIDAVFDCQLAEFILGKQREPYPSLGGTCERRELGRKIDIVKEQYWERGLDTTQVPWDILKNYCVRDIELTERLYLEQALDLHEAGLMPLFTMQNEDLLILEEMEWNGLRYNMEAALARGKEIDAEISRIDADLRCLVPVGDLNYRSNAHLSAIIYGGVLHRPVRERVTRTLADGREVQSERWGTEAVELKGFTKPIRGTEHVKTKNLSLEDLVRTNKARTEAGKTPLERQWSVAGPVLKRLNVKSAKGNQFVEALLRRSELEKQNNTYYTGLVEKMEPMDWPQDHIHGNLNQCVAVTSRLSSSGPNLQNFSGECKDLFYTRF